jgi:hypothetical protein
MQQNPKYSLWEGFFVLGVILLFLLVGAFLLWSGLSEVLLESGVRSERVAKVVPKKKVYAAKKTSIKNKVQEEKVERMERVKDLPPPVIGETNASNAVQIEDYMEPAVKNEKQLEVKEGKGSIKTFGESDGTTLGDYKAELYRIVGMKWHSMMKSRVNELEKGKVKIKFFVAQDGTLKDVGFVEGDSKNKLGELSQNVLLSIERVEPFSEALKKELQADGYWEEITFSTY